MALVVNGCGISVFMLCGSGCLRMYTAFVFAEA